MLLGIFGVFFLMGKYGTLSGCHGKLEGFHGSLVVFTENWMGFYEISWKNHGKLMDAISLLASEWQLNLISSQFTGLERDV